MSNAKPDLIRADGTTVYFFAEIDTGSALELIMLLRQIDGDLRSTLNSLNVKETVPITLRINSGGGSVLDALAIVDAIANLQSPVVGIVEGFAGSAAGLVLMGCDYRMMSPNAYLLVHPVWHEFNGNHKQHTSDQKFLRGLVRRIVTLYVNPKLSRKKVKAMLKKETWLDAAGALERGLIDE